jgi:hypothetical protein
MDSTHVSLRFSGRLSAVLVYLSAMLVVCAPEASSADDPDPVDQPWAPSSPAAAAAERDLHKSAIQLSLSGDINAAWRAISAPANGRAGASPALIGWRAMAVTGALCNQGRTREAHELAEIAIRGAWVEVRDLNSRRELGEALYWATLLADLVGDRDRASRWIDEAYFAHPESERIRLVRLRLERNRAAFPRE